MLKKLVKSLLTIVSASALIFGLLVVVPQANAAAKKTKGLTITGISSDTVGLSWTNIAGTSNWEVKFVAGNTTKTKLTGSSSTSYQLSGLTKNTNYSISVRAKSPTTGAYSDVKKVKTSNYNLKAPTNFTITDATPSTAVLNFTAPAGVAATDVYQIVYGTDEAITKNKKTLFTTDNVGSFGGTPSADGTTTKPEITLTGLPQNKNLYVRVQVANAARTLLSDPSAYAMVKTRLAASTITGTVTVPSGSSLADVVVAAYQGKELIEQVEPITSGPDMGQYTLKVPTCDSTATTSCTATSSKSYKVKASYLGLKDTVSLWAKQGADGIALQAQATSYAPSIAAPKTAADINLYEGGKITGRVTGAGKNVENVYVTALRNSGAAEPQKYEVIARAVTNSAGIYTLKGLPTGDYKVQFRYGGANGDGVGLKASNPTTPYPVTAPDTTSKVDAMLWLSSWSKKTKPTISGTKKVGKTVQRAGTNALASSSPKEYGSVNGYQWYRNGQIIPGATSSSYTITNADKGKKLTVRVYYSHFGYPNMSVVSKGYKVK